MNGHRQRMSADATAILIRQKLLRVFGRLPFTDVMSSRRQASEKPQGRKPRGEFAPAVVSVYGDLAPVYALIFRFRTGTRAE